jgi:choloylglycine hydrolase
MNLINESRYAKFDYGCTSAMGQNKDGTYVTFRNMDFIQIKILFLKFVMNSKVIGIPIGENFQGGAPEGGQGLAFTTKIGTVGANAFEEQKLCDGMNQDGLYISLQSLDCSEYPPVPKGEEDKAIEVTNLPLYLLSQCSTVDQAIAALNDIHVWGEYSYVTGGIPGLHFALYDATGKAAAVEFVNGKTRIYVNSSTVNKNSFIGVMTNDPPYPDHVRNLPSFNGLSPLTPASTMIAGITIPSEIACGWKGMPGAPTSTDRFIRTALEVSTIFNKNNPTCPANTKEGLYRMEQIRQNMNVPEGLVQFPEPDEPIYTLWSSLTALSERKYYVKAWNGCKYKEFDLNKLNFSNGAKFEPVRIWDDKPMFKNYTNILQLSTQESGMPSFEGFELLANKV